MELCKYSKLQIFEVLIIKIRLPWLQRPGLVTLAGQTSLSHTWNLIKIFKITNISSANFPNKTDLL